MDTTKLLVTKSRREILFQVPHCNLMVGHSGQVSTLNQLMARFFWPDIYENVSRWCAACCECQMVNPPATPKAPELDVLREAWEDGPSDSKKEIQYILDLRAKLHTLGQLSMENLLQAQDKQSQLYNRGTRLHEVLAHWCGQVANGICRRVLTPAWSNKPYSAPYRLPEHKKNIVQDELKAMLDMGVIKESHSNPQPDSFSTKNRWLSQVLCGLSQI